MPPEPTRIVLIDMPRILREIVKDVLATDADMMVVGEYAESVRLRDAVSRTSADFVITDDRVSGFDEVGTLLRERPHVRVLAIGENGRDTVLYELRPQKVRLGAVSPENLLEAIRAAVRADAQTVT